jgi:chemotaxis protein MotA
MDRTSVLGLLIGVLAIVGGQILEGGHVGSLSQPTALLIVVGGTLGAVMLQSPYATFVRGIRMVKWVFRPPVSDPQQLIQQIAHWSQVSRREGLLALDALVNELRTSSPARDCSCSSMAPNRSACVRFWRSK